MNDEMIARAQTLYDKCKDETAPGARIAMVELRNLVPQLLAEMRKAGEYVEIERLRLGKQ